MAFIEPMHRYKPNTTYLLTYLLTYLYVGGFPGQPICIPMQSPCPVNQLLIMNIQFCQPSWQHAINSFEIFQPL